MIASGLGGRAVLTRKGGGGTCKGDGYIPQVAVTFIQRVTFSTGRGKLPGGGGDQVVPGLTPDGQTKRAGVPSMGRTWQRPSA